MSDFVSSLIRTYVPLAVASELTEKHVALGSQNDAHAALGKRIESPRPADTPAPVTGAPAEGEAPAAEGENSESEG